MDRCDLYDRWNEMSKQERLDALKELIQDTAEDWGYAPPEVVDGEFDDPGMMGEWDYDSETVSLGMDNYDDPDDAVDAAYHELGHMMEDYDGFGDPETEGTLRAPWEFETEFPTHDDVDAFGEANAEDHKRKCEAREPFESPGRPPPPPPRGRGSQGSTGGGSSSPPDHNVSFDDYETSWSVDFG